MPECTHRVVLTSGLCMSSLFKLGIAAASTLGNIPTYISIIISVGFHGLLNFSLHMVIANV